MTLAGSVRRIVAALVALMTMAVAARAEDVNDYPTRRRDRICVWLPQGEWRDAAGDRAMLLFDRRHRVDLPYDRYVTPKPC
jgi:hypothetical protein